MLFLDKKFAAFLKSLKITGKTPFAVACSGGGDSMALALMAQDWAKTRGAKITALTVDHGLRKESAAEAKQVQRWLKKRGITHVILSWKGKKPASNIQEIARNMRYRLMADYCLQHKITHLLVAHHIEDQAETFLLRLARGSGVDGLAAMSAVTDMHGITLLRPLLESSKSDLLQYLKTHSQPFISDPSNHNAAFDRVKIRKLAPALKEVGLTPVRLAATAANMARARAHLEEETGLFLKRHCAIFPEGYALLRTLHASEEIALRALATLVMIVGGHEVRTRLSDLERLYASLKAPAFKGATLGGCIFTRHKESFLVLREPKAIAAPRVIKPGGSVVWDNRFELTLHTSDHPLRVGALNPEGWLFCANTHHIKNPCPDKRILYTLPALRDASGWIHAVPHLGLAADGVKCEAVFNAPG